MSNGKLKFPLCNKCATTENQGTCCCNTEERCLLGTWCTPELEKAIACGYTIVKIYEIYHWEQSSQYDRTEGVGGLFADFIDTFLKLKQESSGWPSWCMSEEDKLRYINDYQSHEKIRLDYANIVHNPGRRALAKLILNSFWGKFGQRNNLKKTRYVYTQGEFLTQLLDQRNVIDDFHIINENACALTIGTKPDFVEDCPTSNVVIASFTTCWARLRLLDVLHHLDERCLYFDTDSVIFVEDKNEPNPVQLGDYLGDLTNELKPGNHIDTFIGAGPKNYAFRESDGSETCKVRGFTLNYENSRLINFDSVQDLMLNHPNNRIVLPPRTKITRDKHKMTVLNRNEERSYGLVYTKRRVLPSFRTLPFGYVD